MATVYLTLDEVSERMRISAGTARNRLSGGLPMPPSVKIGRRRLFPECAFDDWMKMHINSNDGIFATISNKALVSRGRK